MQYVAICLQGRARDLAGVLGLGFRVFKIMTEGFADAADLVARDPSCRFIWRPYHPDRMGRAGDVVARDDLAYLQHYTPAEVAARIVAVIPVNEPNLDLEHAAPHPSGSWKSEDAYRDMSTWLRAYTHAWMAGMATVPWAIEVWGPALSPGNNPPGTEPEYEYEILAPALSILNKIVVHVYGPLADLWNGSGRLSRTARSLDDLGLGDKPIVVGEVNRVNYADFCRYASGIDGVAGAFWFGWRMNPKHAACNLEAPFSDGIEELLAGHRWPPPPPPPEPDMEIVNGVPIAWGFLKEYRRRGRVDGTPKGSEVHCGKAAIQAFESGAIYVWDGGHVHVLCDRV